MVKNAAPEAAGVEPGAVELICSARGCRAPAAHQLRWNNPKLHAVDARKSWLACEEHRGRLGDFLGTRGFLREILPLPATTAGPDPGDAAPADPAPADPARLGPGRVVGRDEDDSGPAPDGTAAATP